MPTFIPDRLKTPGNFPSIDANDNQIRGFGFFANATARTALDENFRCEGYLAFMKDTDQFKQYNNTVVDDSTWGNDSNWVLLEGTSTDTYWAADADGTGIYYSNQVIVGATTYSGTEKFYVSGDAKITGSVYADTLIQTPKIEAEDGLDIVIDTNEEADSGDDFRVQYKEEDTGTIRTAFDISPYKSTATIEFGNTSDDFKIDTYSSSFSEFRTISSNIDETGFKFSDKASDTKSMLFRMKDDDSYLELKDGGRKITLSPHTYKISSSVEANANVLSGVEMLMPDSATGDWTFNHLANKDYVFNTNTSSDAKLITKFHAFGNGVVSIGTANHYNEYSGIQYTTVLNSLQPRLFIVNDGTSNVGVRVQSGNTSLGEEGARTQGRYFTDIRDDGFYISRVSAGPIYDAEADEGEEWSGGNPDAATGIKRGDNNGNNMTVFARNNVDFSSNNNTVFSVVGGADAGVGDNHKIVLQNHGGSTHTESIEILARPTGDFTFKHSNIGTFLNVYRGQNKVDSGGQILASSIRGAQFNVKSLGDPSLNDTQSLSVYALPGKADNTGYWWGVDGESYDTEADLLAAGTTVNTEKQGDQVAIYVPKHGSGKVGIGTDDPTSKLHVVGNAYVSQLVTLGNNLKFAQGSSGDNFISVSRGLFDIRPNEEASIKIPRLYLGNGTSDTTQFTISGFGSIFESNFLIGKTNYFGFRSPRSSGWTQTNTAKVLSVDVTDNTDGDVDTQFWATDTGVTTNHMTLHKDGRLSLTHKTSSVSIGKDAGLAVGDNMYNVSIGYQANLKDSLGSYNVYIGREAGPFTYLQGDTMTGEWVDRTKAANSGVFVQDTSPEPTADYQVHDYNIGIGFQALKNNQSRQIIGIGYQAGKEYVHQFGRYTDVDTYSGNSSTDGGHIFIGNQAGVSLVRANYGVVAIGELALSSWVQGEGSIVAIGLNAMRRVTSTTRTTAIGNGALSMGEFEGSLKRASYSVAVGSTASEGISSFDDSVAIGEGAYGSAFNRYTVSGSSWNKGVDYDDNAFPGFDRVSESTVSHSVGIGRAVAKNAIKGNSSVNIGSYAVEQSVGLINNVSIGRDVARYGGSVSSVDIGYFAQRANENNVLSVSIGSSVGYDKGKSFVANMSETLKDFTAKSGEVRNKKFRLTWAANTLDTVNYGEREDDRYYITPPFYTAQTGGDPNYQIQGTRVATGSVAGISFRNLGHYEVHIGSSSAKNLMFSSGKNVSIGFESLGGREQSLKRVKSNANWADLITSSNSGYTEDTYHGVRAFKRSLGKGRDKIQVAESDQSVTDIWIDEEHHYAPELRFKVTVNSSGEITEISNPLNDDGNFNYTNRYGGQINVNDEIYIPADGLYSGSSEIVMKITPSDTYSDYVDSINLLGDDNSIAQKLGGGAGFNVAMGYQALSYATGSYANIAIGSRAGYEIMNAKNNILIGSRAGFHLAGDDASGNVIIGSYMGTTNMSDKLVISQTGTSNVTTPLIEGTFTSGSEEVKINGDLEIPSSDNGLILKDSNDVRYRVTVNTSGGLVVTSL